MEDTNIINKKTPVSIGLVIVIVVVALGIAGTAGLAKINKEDIEGIKNDYVPRGEFKMLGDSVYRTELKIDTLIENLIKK